MSPPQRAQQQVAQQRQPLREIDDLRRQRLLARIAEQLASQAFAALGRRGNHVEQPGLLFVGQLGTQPLHAAADDHQEIVEVVRDAAGQLADRFQPLRLAQRAFRRLAPVGFVIEPIGSPQRQPKAAKQERGRRQAEDQMTAHVHEPFVHERRLFLAGQHVNRKSGKLAVSDAAVDVVELRIDRIDRAVEPLRDAFAQFAALVELAQPVFGNRIAREKAAVGARHAVIAAFGAPHLGVEAFKITWQHGDRHDAVELAIVRGPPLRDREKISVESGHARPMHAAHVSAGFSVLPAP